MCWKCRQGFTQDQVISQLKLSLLQANSDPNYFSLWNTTSVGNILYSCVGIDGPEAKVLGLQLLDLFMGWIETQPTSYIPSTGIEPMFSFKVLCNLHNWAKSFTNPNNLTEHQLLELLERKIHEFKKYQLNKNLWIDTGIGIGWCVGMISLGLGLYYLYSNRKLLIVKLKY